MPSIYAARAAGLALSDALPDPGNDDARVAAGIREGQETTDSRDFSATDPLRQALDEIAANLHALRLELDAELQALDAFAGRVDDALARLTRSASALGGAS